MTLDFLFIVSGICAVLCVHVCLVVVTLSLRRQLNKIVEYMLIPLTGQVATIYAAAMLLLTLQGKRPTPEEEVP